jgi:hypothetical protein
MKCVHCRTDAPWGSPYVWINAGWSAACDGWVCPNCRVPIEKASEAKQTRKIEVRVGMPACLLLDQFASYVIDAFGHIPYLVGSALRGERNWHDVDVRLILDDEEYAAQGFGDPADSHRNAKWVATVLAWSAFGKALTGLPIDFQIQQQSWINDRSKGEPRSALGLTPMRMQKEYGEKP